MIDFESVLTSTKSSFTRNRASVIGDYLAQNNNDVIISLIYKKKRGISVKFYYYKNGVKHNDITLYNALTLVQALRKNGVIIKLYNGAIVDCTAEALEEAIQAKEAKAKEEKTKA